MISAEEKSRLKDMGILLNRDGQYFSVRVITENGVIDHLKMKRIAEAAEKFGDGNMAFTSRMTVEITGVEMDNVSSIVEYLKGADLVTGGTGCDFGGVTPELLRYGIPIACGNDGPSGIRMDCGAKATLMPCGTALAASWNDELVERLYTMKGSKWRPMI